MVSHPTHSADSGVELLLESWGGEAAYFWQRDKQLQTLLKSIGRPRVLEIAMPLAYSRHSYSAAAAVVATYGRALGCSPDKHAFDLYSHQPLSPNHIINVHTEGEPDFSLIGQGYPANFVDVDDDRSEEQ